MTNEQVCAVLADTEFQDIVLNLIERKLLAENPWFSTPATFMQLCRTWHNRKHTPVGEVEAIRDIEFFSHVEKELQKLVIKPKN